MPDVVIISGRLCTGKSGLARALSQQFQYTRITTREILRQIAHQRGFGTSREDLASLARTLETETDGRWVLHHVLRHRQELGDAARLVVDNVSSKKQVEAFRAEPSLRLTHVHLYAQLDELKRRYLKRISERAEKDAGGFEHVDVLREKTEIAFLKQDADVRIYVTRTDTRDNIVRVAARLGLYSPPDVRCVDVVVGGQYGSEGKGHIAAYLAKDYDVLVRVGGPNAGHSVSSASGVYVYHQLPSGTKDTSARVLLGPGMTLRVDALLKEIAECGIGPERLFIDPQAMVIEDQDLAAERALVSSIASTGQGGGAAAARRIMGRRPGAVTLARAIDALKPFVGEKGNYHGSTTTQLERAYQEGCSVLLEGTQGSGLSIYHGQYPYGKHSVKHVASGRASVSSSSGRGARCVAESPLRLQLVFHGAPVVPVGDGLGHLGVNGMRLKL